MGIKNRWDQYSLWDLLFYIAGNHSRLPNWLFLPCLLGDIEVLPELRLRDLLRLLLN